MKYAAYYISILSVVLALALSSIFLGSENAWADSVIKTIFTGIGNSPLYPSYDPANGNIYVPNYESGSVSIISGQTNSVIGNGIVRVGQLPWGIAFDSSNNNLYVTNERDSSVSIISGQSNTVIGNPIPVGSMPVGVAYDSANGNISKLG